MSLAQAKPERVLLIRPSALGDVCRSVPVLASLRAAWPEARIDWLVNEAFAPAIAAHPALTEALPFARHAFGAWWNPANAPAFFRWLGGLRRRRYDLVIDCQGLARSAMMTAATRAPVRVGYANAPEGAWLAYNHRKRVDRSLHAVDRMLKLLDPIGVPPVRDMRLYADESSRAAIDRRLGPLGDRLAVVAPTSRWPGKRWPEDRFADLTLALLGRGLADRVAVVGAPGEESQCPQLIALAARDDRVINLVGSCSVGELLAVIERSCLVIANDSAALHIAVGFDRPIVALYGPTDVSRVGPYERDHTVVQRIRAGDRLDHKSADNVELMRRITLDDAIGAAEQAMTPAESAHAERVG